MEQQVTQNDSAQSFAPASDSTLEVEMLKRQNIAGLRHGITRIETLVLVVIAFIALGLLLPVIVKLRNRSPVVVCTSNLGQLASGYNRLMGENEQGTPAFSARLRLPWARLLKEHAGLGDDVYLCPAAPEVSTGFGTSAQSWTMTLQLPEGAVRVISSYASNEWVRRQGFGAKTPKSSTTNPTPARYVDAAAYDAARIPLFADATWVDAMPRADDPTPPNLRDGDRHHQGGQFARENMMGRFTIDRHEAAINVAFLDGHVETVKLRDLKRLTWHSGYKSQDWAPALPSH